MTCDEKTKWNNLMEWRKEAPRFFDASIKNVRYIVKQSKVDTFVKNKMQARTEKLERMNANIQQQLESLAPAGTGH